MGPRNQRVQENLVSRPERGKTRDTSSVVRVLPVDPKLILIAVVADIQTSRHASYEVVAAVTVFLSFQFSAVDSYSAQRISPHLHQRRGQVSTVWIPE